MVKLSSREKAIICGLFLSKFDTLGLKKLGFSTFKEAFNVLGLAISSKPASIKNYRDELDPLFPNTRAGWHKRKMREHCEKIYETYAKYDLDEMAALVSKISDCQLSLELSEDTSVDSDSFAKRLATGRAAENFFIANYREESEFRSLLAIDVTQTGCGYDFKLHNKSDESFTAVEVKGLQTQRGGVNLTSKEYDTANTLGSAYYLYVVKNFEENPYAVKYCDPLRSELGFKRQERQIIQISWAATV